MSIAKPLVTFFLQRKDAGPSNDDVIHIYEDDVYLEMYKVIYKTPETKRQSVFYLTRSKTLAYVSDLLKALTHDVDPFAYLQVSTLIHPSIQFQVSSLWDSRHLIEDMVDMSLRNVERVRQ